MRRQTLLVILLLGLFLLSSALFLPRHHPVSWGAHLGQDLANLWEQALSGEVLNYLIPGRGEGMGIEDGEGTDTAPPFPVHKRGSSWEFRLSSSPSQVHPLVREAAEAIAEGSGAPREAMERIYRWITHNISYDIEKYASGDPYVPDAVETLHTRKGICGDYAALAHEMLTAVGLEARIKTGEVVTEIGREKHAWNEVRIGETDYALDTTWGAGSLSSEGLTFIHHPNSIFLATPEELRALHHDMDYRKQKYQQWMKEEALAASPVYIPGYENNLLHHLNGYRKGEGLQALFLCYDLQNEARKLALEVSDKECRGESWSLELNESRDRLNGSPPIATVLAAKVYFYWGHPPLTPEEIYRGWLEDESGRRAVLSSDYNAAGIGVVKRGDLIVVAKYLAHYRQ